MRNDDIQIKKNKDNRHIHTNQQRSVVVFNVHIDLIKSKRIWWFFIVCVIIDGIKSQTGHRTDIKSHLHSLLLVICLLLFFVFIIWI